MLFFGGETRVLQLLLDCGADVDGNNTDKTPILSTVLKNNTEATVILIQQGADLFCANVTESNFQLMSLVEYTLKNVAFKTCKILD